MPTSAIRLRHIDNGGELRYLIPFMSPANTEELAQSSSRGRRSLKRTALQTAHLRIRAGVAAELILIRRSAAVKAEFDMRLS